MTLEAESILSVPDLVVMAQLVLPTKIVAALGCTSVAASVMARAKSSTVGSDPTSSRRYQGALTEGTDCGGDVFGA